MIFIPGDKVTAITAQNGMLADKRLTSAGGVLFTSVAMSPASVRERLTNCFLTLPARKCGQNAKDWCMLLWKSA